MAMKLSERRSGLDALLRSIVKQTFHYSVTVIDTKPDSEMTAAMGLLAKASHDRHFISDNLYHDVFSVWY